MSVTVLEARGLSVSFASNVVLSDVDFRLGDGEIAVIEGPSGAGKSTLLRALASLEPITNGSLQLAGTPLDDLPPAVFRAAVAYIPQQPVMFDGSVADNLRAGPELRGETVDEARVGELLRLVGLAPDFAGRSARDLSGGEKQRVAIARALANDPRVVLFDEPTSALDPGSADAVLALIRATAGRGRAVAVVTHAREHADALGGQRYRCEAGKLSRLA